MALTETERNIIRQVKSQGGTIEQAKEVLGQFRAKQPTQQFKSLSQTARESLEKTPEEVLGVDSFKRGVSGKQTVFERSEGKDISGLDIGVKTGKAISEFGKETKRPGVGLPDKFSDIATIGDTTIANIVPDAVEGVGEIVELASDPVGTGKSILDIGQGLSDKLVFGILNKISGKDVPPTDQAKIVDAVGKELVDKFGTPDKVVKQVTENPFDTILFAKGIISTAKKSGVSQEVKKDIEKVEKTLSDSLKESAKKDVEQALGATKEKFKQKGRDIAGEVAERGIRGSRKTVQEMAEKKSSELSIEIKEFIDSGKLKGTVKRDDLLNVLDGIRKQGQVGDVIIDESIVNAADKMADAISGFGPEIPADKARTIRQIFDDAVYSTKGVVSEEALSLKNNIKKGLADNIRKQLAEQNPELAKINKEFNFYKTLDEVLTETIDRTGPQQGGLTSNIIGGGGLAGGAVIFGDLTGAIATAAVAKGLSEALKSPRWRLIKASTKNKLAEALSNGDKKAAESISREIIKKVLQEKGNIYLTGQATETNTEINR